MKILLVLNDPPYGTERSYNGLRLAGSLAAQNEVDVTVFLLGDAATCAKAGQKVPNGFYNLEVMIRKVVRKGGEVGACGTCMDARGIDSEELMEGVEKSTLKQLTEWTLEADKVLVF